MSFSDDGKMAVRLSNGTVKSLDELSFSDPRISTVYENAAAYRGYLANQYVLGYDGMVDTDVYDTGFAIISSSAKQGLSFAESTEGFCAQQMGEEVRRGIYDAARFEADLAGGAYDQGADGAQLPVDEWEDGGYNENTISYFENGQLKTDPNTAFFWSGNSEGIGGMEIAAKLAKQKGGVTLETILESKGIILPEFDIKDAIAVRAWQNASVIYAQLACGDVKAIIGSNVREDSIWLTKELPTLMVNTNVTKIILVDPKTLKETVYFER